MLLRSLGKPLAHAVSGAGVSPEPVSIRGPPAKPEAQGA
ncbi:hypothetical protein [Azospirillum doebereinerae]